MKIIDKVICWCVYSLVFLAMFTWAVMLIIGEAISRSEINILGLFFLFYLVSVIIFTGVVALGKNSWKE